MTQHDRTTPPKTGKPQHGFTATAFAVWRRQWRTLAGATVRIVGLSGLAWLLTTAAIFALAWPVFTHMRNERNWYRHVEDPYLHDRSGLDLVALGALPLFLLLLGTGSAALQHACSRAVTAQTQALPEDDESGAGGRGRLRPVLGVYTLRFLIAWPLPLFVAVVADGFTGYHLDTEDQYLERGSWSHTLVEVPRWCSSSPPCCCASRSPSPRPPQRKASTPSRPWGAPGR